MNRMTPESRSPRPSGPRISRRRLFEVGGTVLSAAGLLTACANRDAPAAGRVGNAPEPTDPPDRAVDDNVYLRTLESLEHSVLDVYALLASSDVLDDATLAALTRFTEDHDRTVDALGRLTEDNGGTRYQCANPWLMERVLQPVVDHILGKPADGDEPAIAPSDDPDRDALAVVNSLETLASASYQSMVEKLSTPALRASIVPFGAEAARHAAAAAIIAGGDENRFLSPTLFGEEATADSEGFQPAYAITSRFGRLTPIEVTIGAEDELGLRYTATLETPAENAYRYNEETCPA